MQRGGQGYQYRLKMFCYIFWNRILNSFLRNYDMKGPTHLKEVLLEVFENCVAPF